MTFKLPGNSELIGIATELGLELNKDQADKLLGFMAPFAEGYEYLDKAADVLPEIRQPQRTYEKPDAGENSLGAWYVKTSIKHRDTGPLHGKKIVVKDNISVAGIPMMAGASILEGYVPDYDATVVERILDAGAEVSGKSVCEYFCLSGGSCTASTGVVHNPRKHGYSTGGSSSGSAALVVNGEVDMALGTDQGGSVRIPASWTGAYGMKATQGIVPYTGGLAMETSIDYIGPLTMSVSDNALLLEVLAGYGNDVNQNPHVQQYTAALGKDIAGMKIGVVKEGFAQPFSEADVDDCVKKAAHRFKELGATVENISIPDHMTGLGVWGAIVTDGYWQSYGLNGLGYNYEGVYSPALHRAMEGATSRVNEMPINGQLLMLLGKYLERYHGLYYAKAKNHVRRLRAMYDEAFSNCDILLMPTTVTKASKNPVSMAAATDEEVMSVAFGNTFNTCQFNATGHPAMSIPVGLRDDLPIGMMLVGRYFAESEIYKLAYAYEQSVDWEKE